MGESMETQPLFWKEFFFWFFSSPKCGWALQYIVGPKKGNLLWWKLRVLGRFFGTTQYISKVSSRFEYFFLIFAPWPVLNAEFNFTSNDDSLKEDHLVKKGVCGEIVRFWPYSASMSCWYSLVNLYWLSNSLCWI